MFDAKMIAAASTALASPQEHWRNISYQMQFGLDCEQGFLMLDTSYHLIQQLARDSILSAENQHAELKNNAASSSNNSDNSTALLQDSTQSHQMLFGKNPEQQPYSAAKIMMLNEEE